MRRRWEKELLPQCLAMGIGYDEFWTLNPRKLAVLTEGYKLRRKIEDEKAWLLGGYMFQAVSVSLGNAFRKKSEKAKSYFDIVEKPFLDNIDKPEPTEEEKQKYINAFMASLHIMQNKHANVTCIKNRRHF